MWRIQSAEAHPERPEHSWLSFAARPSSGRSGLQWQRFQQLHQQRHQGRQQPYRRRHLPAHLRGTTVSAMPLAAAADEAVRSGDGAACTPRSKQVRWRPNFTLIHMPCGEKAWKLSCLDVLCASCHNSVKHFCNSELRYKMCRNRCKKADDSRRR